MGSDDRECTAIGSVDCGVPQRWIDVVVGGYHGFALPNRMTNLLWQELIALSAELATEYGRLCVIDRLRQRCLDFRWL